MSKILVFHHFLSFFTGSWSLTGKAWTRLTLKLWPPSSDPLPPQGVIVAVVLPFPKRVPLVLIRLAPTTSRSTSTSATAWSTPAAKKRTKERQGKDNTIQFQQAETLLQPCQMNYRPGRRSRTGFHSHTPWTLAQAQKQVMLQKTCVIPNCWEICTLWS